MGWLIFWVIFVLYWVIGIKRLGLYYKRVDAYNSKEYPSLHAHNGMKSSAVWGSVMLVSVWPYYEFCRWFQNYMIHTMTADERRQKEYEAAEKIVADYTERKEREEREAFDRQLRDDK